MALELHPLEQFVIKPIVPLHIGKLDISFTNSALLMTIAVLLATAVVVIGTRREELVPSRIQSLGELAYEFIGNMIDETVGTDGQRYFPFVFTLFMFILFGNVLGLIPFGYTFTGQLIVTFAMAAVVFVGVTLIGIWRHGWRFLSFFVPHGVPIVLLLLLVPIELLSYLIRPFTLSIRLFANMLAGHTMLAIFGGFAASIGILGLLPLGLDVLIFFLELLVAVLQAYVFTILTCLYLNDAINLH